MIRIIGLHRKPLSMGWEFNLNEIHWEVVVVKANVTLTFC